MYPTTDERAAPGISISPFLAYDDSMIVDDCALVIANADPDLIWIDEDQPRGG